MQLHDVLVGEIVVAVHLLAVDDLTGAVDPVEMAVKFGRLTRAIDRIAVVSESGPSLDATALDAAVLEVGRGIAISGRIFLGSLVS